MRQLEPSILLIVSAISLALVLSSCAGPNAGNPDVGQSSNAGTQQVTSVTTSVSGTSTSVSGTSESAESCIDIGKPNPSQEEENKSALDAMNRILTDGGGTALAEFPAMTMDPDFLNLKVLVPKGGYARLAEAVCNKRLSAGDQLLGSKTRGALTNGGLIYCNWLRTGRFSSIDELKSKTSADFAKGQLYDSDGLVEDLSGTTYDEYVENNDNYAQAAVDYLCPQFS